MTKSTITRERLEQLADNNTICKVSWDERIELAQIELAALDSEPVAEVTGEEHRQLRDLVMMVKMLCRTVRKYNPESQQAANFTAYLQKEGLISAADCLRETDPLDTESEDRRG
ncbi:hypothetical protein ACYCMW_25685 [Klebsiella pneumoniae]